MRVHQLVGLIVVAAAGVLFSSLAVAQKGAHQPRIDMVLFYDGQLEIVGANFASDSNVTLAGTALPIVQQDPNRILAGSLGGLSSGTYTLRVETQSPPSSAAAELTVQGDDVRVRRIEADQLLAGSIEANGLLAGIASIGPSSFPGAVLTVSGDLRVDANAFVAGTVFASAVVTASDSRLKKDVTPLAGSLNMLRALRGVRFAWRDARSGERPQLGVIAQEVETVLPEAIRTTEHGTKSVLWSAVSAVMIESIKEQQLIIERQRAEIDALSARLAALENGLARLAERAVLAKAPPE